MNTELLDEVREIHRGLRSDRKSGWMRVGSVVCVLTLLGVLPWLSLRGELERVRTQLFETERLVFRLGQNQQEDLRIGREMQNEAVLMRARFDALSLSLRLVQEQLDARARRTHGHPAPAVGRAIARP